MFSEYTNRSWVLQTWLVSISLGMFSVGHFVGRKLQLVSLIFIIFTYTLFWYGTLTQLSTIAGHYVAAITDLETIRSRNGELSMLAERNITVYGQFGESFFPVSYWYLPLLYFGSVIYLAFQYINGTKGKVEKKS